MTPLSSGFVLSKSRTALCVVGRSKAAKNPCFDRVTPTRGFPSGVRGPVDREALRRLASSLRELRAIGPRQTIEVGEVGEVDEVGIPTGLAAIAGSSLGGPHERAAITP